MDETPPRLAVRALIVDARGLLLVNAYPGDTSDLWCAPGGGVEKHASLPDNLKREVREETGLAISVGAFAGVNEFHAPERGFHQVELFFHATILSGELDPTWRDPEAIVNKRRFFRRNELGAIRFKPGSLETMAFEPAPARYDPLELMVR
ncbi:MAG: NUDIX hydrolase [Devosiaceae bacterium]|nr:NUDIX hydrolase [Devosiaceae bacterium MH13]